MRRCSMRLVLAVGMMALHSVHLWTPLEAIAAHPSIVKLPGLPPRAGRAVVLDMRPSERARDDDGISLREVVMMSGDAPRLFELEPDSIKISVDEHVRSVCFELLTPTPAEAIKLMIVPAFETTVVAEMGYRKPKGVTRAFFRWDLTDSTGQRVPPRFYFLNAEGETRSAYGLVRVRRQR